MSKVLLCIPPDYDYNFPPLATPALSAFLKQHNITTSQIDLNLGYRSFLLDHVRGKKLSAAMKEDLLKDILSEFYSKRLKKRYYSGFLPGSSDRVSLNLPYDNNTNSSFYFTERLLSSSHLFRYLDDECENTFLQFYRKRNIIGRLKRDKIDILGISIISPSQVIAGLTLGLLVKREIPSIHVNIGGQWPTLYRGQIIKAQDLFRCFDSVIVFEGETPLLNLARALKTNAPLRIRNVITKGSLDDFSLNRSQEDMDSLPAPDFKGLPLSKYLGSPGRNRGLTFETSRGCYWSKCAYCVDLPLPKPAYRSKNAKLVVRDMLELRENFKATNLLFGDPGLSPRSMLDISRMILKKGLKIGWWTMARLDPGFTREIFDTAFRAGLSQINFGFESASDRVCGLLHKGNNKERSQRVIRDCSMAGIKVDLQTMIGLPNETFQDGLETVDFLVSNKEFIDDVTFNIYYLTPANYIFNDPGRYNIKYAREAGLPFRF
ncbi:MAG: radical SAM protein, partial [Candidatus Omnitrophota bacterium]